MELTAFALSVCNKLIEQLRDAKHGEKGLLVQNAVNILGISRNQLYRHLEQLGYKQPRKTRSDKGETKVSEDEVKLIANLVQQSKSATDKQRLTLRKAQRIAEENQLLTCKISPSRLANVMKNIGVHPEQMAQPRAYRQMRTEHPNQLWQIDASSCVLFYLQKGRVAVMDERQYNLKKPKNVEKISSNRVTRYVVTDHHSGAFYVHYVHGVESSENFVQTLIAAMTQRGNKPFYGVPYNLYFDAASAHQASMSTAFLEWLGITYRHHLPNNSQATGSVERAQNLIEREFEGVLYMMQINSLEELNQYAHKWMHAFQSNPNMNIVRRHGHTRYAMWSTIKNEQLRICPEYALCQSVLAGKPEPRKVNPDQTVAWGGKKYCVRHITQLRIGDNVTVRALPYREDCIKVTAKAHDGADTHHECPVVICDAAGFRLDAPVLFKEHKSAGDSVQDTHRKEMRREAYGTESVIEADKKRAQRKPAFEGKLNPMADVDNTLVPDYLPKKGVELPVAKTSVQLPPLKDIDLRITLRERLGRAITQYELDYIRQLYVVVTMAEIDAIVANLKGKSNVTNLKKAAG